MKRSLPGRNDVFSRFSNIWTILLRSLYDFNEKSGRYEMYYCEGIREMGEKIIAAFRDHSIPAPLVTYIFLVYTLVFIPRHRTAFLYSDWP